MSVQDFIKDPESYSKSHSVQLTNKINADTTRMRAINTVQRQGWSSIRYETEPAHFTDFAFDGDTDFGYIDSQGKQVKSIHNRIGKGHAHFVIGKSGYQDKGICFLPWAENAVTCIKIPGSAKTFFTGPLSGCSIYIGEHPDGSLWGFHANRNNAEGDRNKGLKLAMTDLTAVGVGVNKIRHWALYKQQYSDEGFVFGQKNWRGNWNFYIADVQAKNQPCKVTKLP